MTLRLDDDDRAHIARVQAITHTNTSSGAIRAALRRLPAEYARAERLEADLTAARTDLARLRQVLAEVDAAQGRLADVLLELEK